MNPRLLLCLVASSVGAWSMIHAQGVSEDCCLNYHPCLPSHLLHNIRDYRRQEVSGSCNLPAVIFFSKDKTLCVNPRDKWVQKIIGFLDAGNKTLSKHHRRHRFHGHPFSCKQAGLGNSKLPPPKFRRPTRSNKRENFLLTKTNAGP